VGKRILVRTLDNELWDLKTAVNLKSTGSSKVKLTVDIQYDGIFNCQNYLQWDGNQFVERWKKKKKKKRKKNEFKYWEVVGI